MNNLLYFYYKINFILESVDFYTKIHPGTGCFEIIESQNVLISGLVHLDESNHLISPEPPTDYEVNIENEWISDIEIYRVFSENNINISNNYCTIQKIVVKDKGIVFYKITIHTSQNTFVTT